MDRKAEELLSAFARLARMHVSVYDREFHTVFSVNPSPSSCFCSVLHQTPKTLELCIASDLDARRACLESGRLYAYRCPFGLFEAIVPLYVCGELNGFLLAGKSLPEGGEALSLSATEPYLQSEEERERLADALALLNRHTSREYEDLCLVLTALADRLSSMGGIPDGTANIPAGVRRYLRKNFRSPITLAELSLSFHCSTVSLTKWYYREYGKTIMEELLAIRMEQAKEMLLASEHSVSVIADACGYPDGGYFSKCFRRYTGNTPTEWRRIHRS